MTSSRKAYTGADIFDGFSRHKGCALVVEAGRVVVIQPEADLEPSLQIERLNGGVLFPGFVDLQVNGGGGVMFNDDPSVEALQTMARAHAGLGATSILPTLISDAKERTCAAIAAVEQAIAEGVPGILGLHLEGPHLSIARKGAHDPSFIRPMQDDDIATLLDAARRIPVLKMTLAPESATPEQVAALSAAGIVISLGHSDASYAECAAFAVAGASCVTHLFNAMSQFGNREPGLVGAALCNGGLSAGLIADGIHVHPESIRMALAAKQAPGRLFLVSDAMAVAGTSDTEFQLNGRKVLRQDGRLTLENGTLAGADLDLITAVGNLLQWNVSDEDTALSMATSIPAEVAGLAGGLGTLMPGAAANFQHGNPGAASSTRVWIAGRPL